ncbi:MAG: response regulator transcription factor [Planctomycetota bacterium]|nr:response regulator transcription factor [Planctomycetota bacterium]
MGRTKILIVEDDKSLSEVLSYNLEKEGFNVFKAFDGRTGIEQAKLKKPEIVLLDVMLPGVNGIDVCRQMRKMKETKEAGILMLTAKSEDLDQVGGFEAGADDYVVKPYSMRVLLERIRALLRRKSAEEEEPAKETLECHGVQLDMRRYKASVDGNRIELTRSEFKLLATLLATPGKAYERSELIEFALGDDTLVLERTIDVHIRAIRRKLGERSDVVETVRGVGYRFMEADTESTGV